VATDNLAVCNICTVNVKESKITIFTFKQFSGEQFWNICNIFIFKRRRGMFAKILESFIINFPKLEFKFSDWRSKAVESDSPNFLQTFMGERGLQSNEVKIRNFAVEKKLTVILKLV